MGPEFRREVVVCLGGLGWGGGARWGAPMRVRGHGCRSRLGILESPHLILSWRAFPLEAAPWCEVDVDSICEDPYASRPARLGQDRNDVSYVPCHNVRGR